MKTIWRGYRDFFESRIRRNLPGYFRAFRGELVLVSLAALADLISTIRFMAAGQIEDEFHPVIRLVSVWFGPYGGPVIGKLGQLLAVVFLTLVFRRWARILFGTVIFIYAYAAWYNTWGLHLYTPRFLRWFGT